MSDKYLKPERRLLAGGSKSSRQMRTPARTICGVRGKQQILLSSFVIFLRLVRLLLSLKKYVSHVFITNILKYLEDET